HRQPQNRIVLLDAREATSVKADHDHVIRLESLRLVDRLERDIEPTVSPWRHELDAPPVATEHLDAGAFVWRELPPDVCETICDRSARRGIRLCLHELDRRRI